MGKVLSNRIRGRSANGWEGRGSVSFTFANFKNCVSLDQNFSVTIVSPTFSIVTGPFSVN